MMVSEKKRKWRLKELPFSLGLFLLIAESMTAGAG